MPRPMFQPNFPRLLAFSTYFGSGFSSYFCRSLLSTSGSIRSLIAGSAMFSGGTTTTLIKVDEKWYRADPKGAPADEVSADIVRPIVDAAADLAAARWAAYDAKDPARFGLERPALKIKAATEKTSATILISDQEVPADVASLADQKPVRYAMTEGGPRIAVLAGRALDALLAAPKAVEPKQEEPALPK